MFGSWVSEVSAASSVRTGQRPEARSRLSRAAHRGGARPAGRLCLRERRDSLRVGAALGDCPLEQSLRRGRDQLRADTQPAGRLTEDRHVLRVAAEARDVVLHPLERELLVHQAVVAGVVRLGPGAQRGMREEAEQAEPVVDRHDHNTLLDEVDRVVVAALAADQRAAVDPHHHRQLRRRPRRTRRVDVQEEAVLIRALLAEEPGGLRARRAEGRRVQHLPPARVRLWRLPAELADRRGRVRDAQELLHVVRDDAADEPACRLRDRAGCGCGAARVGQGGGHDDGAHRQNTSGSPLLPHLQLEE